MNCSWIGGVWSLAFCCTAICFISQSSVCECGQRVVFMIFGIATACGMFAAADWL
jgi:hypothetical protein